MNRINLLFVCFLLARSVVAQSDLVINEVMLSNSSTVSDEDGDYVDWIELYNAGATSIDLTGYGISDDLSQPFKWEFPPTTINAGDHLLIFASDKDRYGPPYLHTNFKLSSDGEALVLTNPSFVTEDLITAISLATDISYGRSIDGGEFFERFQTPSPDQSNATSPSILFSHESGFYPSDFDLMLVSNTGDPIRYTTDGSDPTSTSPLYSLPLTLGSLLGQPDVISAIQTSPAWAPASSDDFKANVIKVASFAGNVLSSQTYCKTYFIDPDTNSRYQDYTLVSIITDPNNLFDTDTGIYVPGANFTTSNPVWSGNYFQKGRDWERDGNMQYFDQNGKLQLDQSVGLRVHGGKNRNAPQKSLRVYARQEYLAPKINYPFFENTDHRIYDKLILRSSGNCWNSSVIKDGCTAYICRELDFESSNVTPTVVFINGEYWGLHSIREYFDDDYFADKYDIEKDSVNIVLHGSGYRPGFPIDWGTDQGTNLASVQLYDYLDNNNLGVPANYAHVQNLLDIGSIVDYYCAEIYFNNKDWPTNNNKLWSDGLDGKWRQIMYDLDGGWQYLGVGYNALSRALATNGSAQNSPYATFLLRKLFESQDFEDAFLIRMACLMKNEFDADTVNAAVDLFKNQYLSGMPEHVGRWHDPSSMSTWTNAVAGLTAFGSGRKAYVIQHISARFGINFDPSDYSCTGTTAIVSNVSSEPDLLTIYPNPTNTGSVWLDLHPSNERAEIEIYDSMGRLLDKRVIQNHEHIMLGYSSGTYLIRAFLGTQVVTKRVIVQGSR